jgi:hypothetical protein
MTLPNLAKLFEQANRGSALSPETQLAAEKAVRKLLMTHGEALIAALDEARDIIEEHLPGHSVWLEQTKALLAQLESEAQP